MKTNIKHQIVLLFLLMTTVFFSCEKIDNTYSEFVGDGEISYIAKADSLEAHNGRSRVMLTWLVSSDPRVTDYKIYWDNRKDSIEGSMEKSAGIDSVSVIVNNLAEGVHYFEVYMYDKEGNSSVRSETIGYAYDSVYQESLLSREPENIRKAGSDSVEVTWLPGDDNLIYVDVRYLNNDGDSVFLRIPDTIAVSILGKISNQNEFSYRSAFLPDSTAIDTFFTPFEKKVDLAFFTDKKIKLTFQDKVQYGSQENQMSVLISTDFGGVYDIANIEQATWTDIAGYFPWATSTSYQLWGPTDIMTISEGKPFYIAFRYTTLPQGDNGAQRTWTIKEFELRDKDDNLLFDNFPSSFTMILDGPYESGRASKGSSSATFRGNKTDTESKTAAWLISEKMNY